MPNPAAHSSTPSSSFSSSSSSSPTPIPFVAGNMANFEIIGNVVKIYLTGAEALVRLNQAFLRETLENGARAVHPARDSAQMPVPVASAARSIAPILEKSMAYSNKVFDILAGVQREVVATLNGPRAGAASPVAIPGDLGKVLDLYAQSMQPWLALLGLARGPLGRGAKPRQTA
jgi:hypothetical protein